MDSVLDQQTTDKVPSSRSCKNKGRLRCSSSGSERTRRMSARPRPGSSCSVNTATTDEKLLTTSPLNLTLYGSPAPRCYQRSTAQRARNPLQPPNSPEVSKPRKPLPLPIDKIILLTERMNFDGNEKIKLELSSRQLKLPEDASYRRSPRSFRRSDDDPPLSSSTIDLSIDISSLTNSRHESEDSSDECEPEFHVTSANRVCRTADETDSTSSWSHSPVPPAWNGPQARCISPASRDDSSDTRTTYPWTYSTKDSLESSRCPDSCGETFEDGDFVNAQQKLPVIPQTSNKNRRAGSADLIYVYVNSVSNKENLSKYFRTCPACDEASCICPDKEVETSRTFHVQSSWGCAEGRCERGLDACRRRSAPENLNDFAAENFPVKEKETEEEVLNKGSPSPHPCSDFSAFSESRSKKLHRKQRLTDHMIDSGTSTLQLDEGNDIESVTSLPGKQPSPSTSHGRKPMSMPVLQLATAAQCARILADSLESVLSVIEEGNQDFLENKANKKTEPTILEDMDFRYLLKTLDFLKGGLPSRRKLDTSTWAQFEESEPAGVAKGSHTYRFDDNFDENIMNRNH